MTLLCSIKKRSSFASPTGRIGIVFDDDDNLKGDAYNGDGACAPSSTLEGPMAQKTKTKRVILSPERRSTSFTRAELLKAIREVAAARKGKQGARAHGSK